MSMFEMTAPLPDHVIVLRDTSKDGGEALVQRWYRAHGHDLQLRRMARELEDKEIERS